jgi:molybdopterin biosynthesis enzyme MoaB
MNMDTLRIGLVSVSDRASSGVYQDKGIPALEEWLAQALTTPLPSKNGLSRTNKASLNRRFVS